MTTLLRLKLLLLLCLSAIGFYAPISVHEINAPRPAPSVVSESSLAVGAVPCTGALLVLLFGLANDLLWPSITLVVAISLGMAIALSGVGIAAILGRRFLDRRTGDDEARGDRLTANLRVVAAAGICLVGCLLFAVAW